MILTNCNCGEKVACNCGTLSFDSYVASSTSVLDVGNLVSSNGCVLDEYVIDWYRDGVHSLVTGKGYDPDIEAFHPMTGTSALPVIGGTYTAVVRYIVVEGQQLFLEPKACKKWCEVVQNLPTIIVALLDCESSNITGDYQYRISYSSNDPTSLPARTIAWKLPADGGMGFFAVNFYGYDVGDQIEIFFNNESNLLTRWIVGTNVSAQRYLTAPYKTKLFTNQKIVVALPPYTGSDLLLIKITPSIEQPAITETDWRLDIKCIPTTIDWSSPFTLDQRQLDFPNWEFVDVPASCRFEFRVPLLNPPVSFSSLGEYFHFVRYADSGFSTHNYGDIVDNKAYIRFPYSKSAVAESYTPTGYNTRYASVGNINLDYSGGVFTWTFASIDDYNDVYSKYQGMIASTWYTNAELIDDTDIKYYRHFRFNWKSRPANCGDNALSFTYGLNFHIKSTVVFQSSEGVHTVTITPFSVTTNNWSSEACNNAVTAINQMIINIQNTISMSNFNEDSLCFENPMFQYGYGYTGTTFSFTKNLRGGYSYTQKGYNHPSALFPGTCMVESTFIHAYVFYIQVEITLDIDPLTGDFPRDEYGDYVRDPLQNFKVWNVLDPTTHCYVTASESNLVMTVIDGVVYYPAP